MFPIPGCLSSDVTLSAVVVCAVSAVIDLACRRKTPTRTPLLQHPSGVLLPSDTDELPGLIDPELRVSISRGEYASDLIGLLPELLREDDRVLVVGDGFGLISSLIARSELVKDVIVTEADAALSPYLKSVHTLNGTPWVETVNAFPGIAKCGRVPFFSRRDPRQSSLRPEDGPWQRVSIAPLIDLDLMLAEARISLVVWTYAAGAASMLAEVDLRGVERIVLHSGSWAAPLELLEDNGFVGASFEETVLLRRSD